MKVVAYIHEYVEGSDDPRAIEGGGGSKWRMIDARTASLWLIKAYVRALTNKYGEQYKIQIVRTV